MTYPERTVGWRMPRVTTMSCRGFHECVASGASLRCVSRSSSHLHLDPQAGGGEQRDQRINREQVQLAPHKIGDSWLSNAQLRRGLRLGEALLFDLCDERVHHFGAEPQVQCFLPLETQLLEHVIRFAPLSLRHDLLLHCFAIPLRGQFDVGSPALLRLLHKCVQHVNGVLEFRHVEHAVFASSVHSNFDHAGAGGFDRLPVSGLQVPLHAFEFVPSVLAGNRREMTGCVPGCRRARRSASAPHPHWRLYNKLYSSEAPERSLQRAMACNERREGLHSWHSLQRRICNLVTIIRYL